MDDQTIMQDLLLTTKGACDLYMHGVIESTTPNVRQAFNAALNSQLNIQDTIYRQMMQKGWYQEEQAPGQQAAQVKQKFSPSC